MRILTHGPKEAKGGNVATSRRLNDKPRGFVIKDTFGTQWCELFPAIISSLTDKNWEIKGALL